MNAEVFGRFDKAGPEVFLPVTVDGYPGSQRVFGRGNPAREAKAITRKVFGEWRQDIRHVSVHFFTEGMIDAAFTNVCFLDREIFLHNHRGWKGPNKLIPFGFSIDQFPVSF